MKLEGDYLFEATVPEVWSALFDPVILAAVMPGCEKLELVDGHYVGDIKVKVGPIQGNFTGKVDLKDKVEPESYTMIVDGRGAPGFVKATAHVKLAAEGDATRVRYDTDAQVGGKIASVGQRLLEASARAIVAQSLEGLHANIKLRAAAYREAAARQAAEAPTAAEAAPEAPAAPASAVETPAAVASAVASAEPASEPPVTPARAPAVEPASSFAVFSEETVRTSSPTYMPMDEMTVRSAVPPAPTPATTKPTVTVATAATPVPTKPAAPPVTSPMAVPFTPVKVKQSAVANAVAKEVASTLFPRSVLIAIILIEALIIVWLLVRH
jgi:carbon monoxide dehydrogenase subunit G